MLVMNIKDPDFPAHAILPVFMERGDHFYTIESGPYHGDVYDKGCGIIHELDVEMLSFSKYVEKL